MPLVEGMGDEVTLILGLLTVIIVLLIAWLSTHTRDIPFFSVIVVELSQRAARNQQSRSQTPDNQQQQSVQESGETSSPSVLPTDAQTEVVHRSKPSLSVNLDYTQAETIGNSDNAQFSDISVDSNSEQSSSPGEQHLETSEVSDSVNESSQANNAPDIGNKQSLSDSSQTDVKSKTDTDSSPTAESRLGDSSTPRTADSTDSSETSARVTQTQSLPISQTDATVESDVTHVRHRQVPSSEPTSSPATESTTHPTTPPNPHTNIANQDFLDSSNMDHIGQIRIRLKYLNDTQRLVYCSPTDTIGQFKRAHFSSELEANKLVRLIFNGQDMRNDTNTLQGYNITDNSVIHCLITQNLQGTAQPRTDTGDGDVQLGAFMMPLFAIILAAVWYLRITQRQYFNAVSTLSLAGVTFLFLLGCASVWRTGDNREHQHVD